MKSTVGQSYESVMLTGSAGMEVLVAAAELAAVFEPESEPPQAAATMPMLRASARASRRAGFIKGLR